jgi:hypothetical protein
MPLYTFTNSALDGDLDNVANWDISGSPAGGVPGSSDSATLDAQTVSTGSLAAPVVSASGATISGGSFNNGFAASNVNISGGTFSGSVDFGSGTTLNVDPGAAFSAAGATFSAGTFSNAITDNGGCVYQSGCTYNVAFVLGAGSTINGGTFNNAISTVTSGAYPTVNDGAFASGSTFTATYIYGGAFPDGTVFHACNIVAGNFGTTSTGCTVIGSTAISGGAWTQLTVNSDVQFSGSPTFSAGLTIHYIRGPYTYNANIANVTISVPDPGYPAQNEVLSGIGAGDIGDGNGPLYTGTLTLPATGDVRSGVTYGIGGSGSTGAYIGGTVPAASDVRNGISVGSGAGTLVVPAANNVLLGVTFDNGITGSLDMAATRLGSGLIRGGK